MLSKIGFARYNSFVLSTGHTPDNLPRKACLKSDWRSLGTLASASFSDGGGGQSSTDSSGLRGRSLATAVGLSYPYSASGTTVKLSKGTVELGRDSTEIVFSAAKECDAVAFSTITRGVFAAVKATVSVP